MAKSTIPICASATTDVKDAAQRLLENLSGALGHQYNVPDDAVLVAEDLSPADLSMLEGDKFKGIVLATGGVTSHASILAKSFEIPSVVAIEDLMESVHQGDMLIVDGNAGGVHVNPSTEVIGEYDRLERDYAELNRELGALKDLPPETTDGRRVSLYANIGLLSDVAFAHLHGAQGIGLYRTEIAFLSHRDFPSEEEQYALYKLVIEGMAGKPVTIRTLDIGADKYPTYMRSMTRRAQSVSGLALDSYLAGGRRNLQDPTAGDIARRRPGPGSLADSDGVEPGGDIKS